MDFSKLSLSSEGESKLIELSFDRSPKLKFEAVGHAEFWFHISNEYRIAERALNTLLSFTTAYLAYANQSFLL